MSSRTLSVGIDSGGSRSRLLAARGDTPDGTPIRLDGPGTNARILGTDGTADVLVALLRDAVGDDASDVRLAAGVAGAGRPGDRTALRDAIAARLGCPPTHVQVVADADLALDAAFGHDGGGLVVISGTGSIAYARDEAGILYRAGGWGRLLGDEGSGYHLGLRGLQAVADALDGGPPTALRTLAATTWDAPDAAALLASVYDRARSPATFAPLVLEAAWTGDPVAQSLVKDGAEALALRASWAVERAGRVPRRYALVGGMTEHEGYRTALVQAIASVLPGWTPVRATVEPVEAAFLRARRMA